MTKRFYHLLFLMAAAGAVTGCSGNDTKNVNTPVAPKKPQLMAPFRFHKLIEVSPGQSYDVFSWGRGSLEAGSFMILHSDSSGIKYTTTTGDLEGNIVDVYNADMDVDGNPEILIQARSKDTISRTNVYAYEFNNNKANKLDFPRLNSSQRKGYRGDDNFYIRDGKLIREFQIFNGTGKDAKPSGAKRQLEYSLRSNEFTVKQLSKDSTDVKSTAVNTQSAKSDDKPSTSSKKSEKKHSSAKKKKHRHHHRD